MYYAMPQQLQLIYFVVVIYNLSYLTLLYPNLQNSWTIKLTGFMGWTFLDNRVPNIFNQGT